MERNKIFFSKETIIMHQDKQYSIIGQHTEKPYLKIMTKRGAVYYEIGKDLRLNYTRLMEEIM